MTQMTPPRIYLLPTQLQLSMQKGIGKPPLATWRKSGQSKLKPMLHRLRPTMTSWPMIQQQPSQMLVAGLIHCGHTSTHLTLNQATDLIDLRVVLWTFTFAYGRESLALCITARHV